MNDQISIFTDNPEYEAFVNKFKPKKTTDDCYTPPKVYEAVKDWVCEEYGVNPDNIVRPGRMVEVSGRCFKTGPL